MKPHFANQPPPHAPPQQLTLRVEAPAPLNNVALRVPSNIAFDPDLLATLAATLGIANLKGWNLKWGDGQIRLESPADWTIAVDISLRDPNGMPLKIFLTPKPSHQVRFMNNREGCSDDIALSDDGKVATLKPGTADGNRRVRLDYVVPEGVLFEVTYRILCTPNRYMMIGITTPTAFQTPGFLGQTAASRHELGYYGTNGYIHRLAKGIDVGNVAFGKDDKVTLTIDRRGEMMLVSFAVNGRPMEFMYRLQSENVCAALSLYNATDSVRIESASVS